MHFWGRKPAPRRGDAARRRAVGKLPEYRKIRQRRKPDFPGVVKYLAIVTTPEWSPAHWAEIGLKVAKIHHFGAAEIAIQALTTA
jgi:hypothetical protein